MCWKDCSSWDDGGPNQLELHLNNTWVNPTKTRYIQYIYLRISSTIQVSAIAQTWFECKYIMLFCMQWRSSSQFEPDLNGDVTRFTRVHRKKTLLSTIRWRELRCRRILQHCADGHARVGSEVGKPCPPPGEQLLQQQRKQTKKKRKTKISLVSWLLFFQSQMVETYLPGPEQRLKVAASCCNSAVWGVLFLCGEPWCQSVLLFIWFSWLMV